MTNVRSGGAGGVECRPRAGRCLLRHGAGADAIKSEEAAAITIRQTNEPAGTPGNRSLKYRDGDEPYAATISDGMVSLAMAAGPRPLGETR